MSFLYIVSLIILFTVFVLVMYFIKYMKNCFFWNVVFISLVFSCYLSMVIIALVKSGPYDWNFHETLPTARISPFMFCFSPLYLVLPNKIKKYFGTLISLLCVGMIISPIAVAIRCFYINYAFHVSYLLDFIAHFSFALFGIFLIQSKQVELKTKNVLIGGGIIIVVSLFMIIINLIFDTSFFGLSLRGKHNTYNLVIVDNSFLSAVIYFSGLIIVLLLGLVFQKLLFEIMEFYKNKSQDKQVI